MMIKVRDIAWNEPEKPNAYCSYDHCIGEAPLGRFQIEWKSWKDYPAYTVDFNDGFIGTFNTLEDAKEFSYSYIEKIILDSVYEDKESPKLLNTKDIQAEYERVMHVSNTFEQTLKDSLTGKLVYLQYRGKKRKAAILNDFFSADNWGITVHVGIFKMNGEYGFIDDHSASYRRLKGLEFIES